MAVEEQPARVRTSSPNLRIRYQVSESATRLIPSPCVSAESRIPESATRLIPFPESATTESPRIRYQVPESATRLIPFPESATRLIPSPCLSTRVGAAQKRNADRIRADASGACSRQILVPRGLYASVQHFRGSFASLARFSLLSRDNA